MGSKSGNKHDKYTNKNSKDNKNKKINSKELKTEQNERLQNGAKWSMIKIIFFQI